jgi:membrane protease YdiL (CAAX protease family)
VNAPQARRVPWDAGALVLSMIVFGFGTQRAEWRWASCAGLVVAGWILARWGVAVPEAPALFGLRLRCGRFLPKLLLSLAVGAVLAIAFHAYRGWDWLPRGLTWFAVIAALIGAAEELIYRGYVYGRMRAWGALCAVATAAAGHTLYKCALFALASSLAELLFLAGATFLAGLLFGLMRERLGSTVFPLAAHAAFDVLVYGAWAGAPWWVWRM